MPTFKLVSTMRTIEFPGHDAGAALHIACTLGLDEADLFQEDRYLLTLRRGGAMPSCWTILSNRDGRARLAT